MKFQMLWHYRSWKDQLQNVKRLYKIIKFRVFGPVAPQLEQSSLFDMCQTSSKEEILFTLCKTKSCNKKSDAYNVKAGNKETLPSEFYDLWTKV